MPNLSYRKSVVPKNPVLQLGNLLSYSRIQYQGEIPDLSVDKSVVEKAPLRCSDWSWSDLVSIALTQCCACMASCHVLLHSAIRVHMHCQFIQQEHEDFSHKPRTIFFVYHSVFLCVSLWFCCLFICTESFSSLLLCIWIASSIKVPSPQLVPIYVIISNLWKEFPFPNISTCSLDWLYC